MRAILINPYLQTVTEVDCNGDCEGETGFYELLGAADAQFSGRVDVSRVGKEVDLWVDDAACLDDGRPVFQMLEGNYFAGAALLMCHDGMGATTPLGDWISLDAVRGIVTWPDLLTTGHFAGGGEADIDHPVFGKIRQIDNGTPVYRTGRGYGVYVERPDGWKLETVVPFVTRADALAWVASVKSKAAFEIRELGAA